MTAAQHRESAEINFSLMALKDCFRVFHLSLMIRGDAFAPPAVKIPAAVQMPDVVSSAAAQVIRQQNAYMRKQFATRSRKGPGVRQESYMPMNDIDAEEIGDGSEEDQGNYRTSVSAKNVESVATAGDSGLDDLPLSDGCGGDAAELNTCIRIPYRASLLTRVLKDCFVDNGPNVSKNGVASASRNACDLNRGNLHRTTLIATVSPTAVDLQHSINTLNHTVSTSPWLYPLVNTVLTEVPITTGAATFSKPVSEWSHDEVVAWLAVAERGRFAQLVLPKGIGQCFVYCRSCTAECVIEMAF
jgi:hypothetical protein